MDTNQSTEPDTNPKQQSSPGIVILQWLTYAFWGWLIVGLIWLISVILINAILGESVSGVVPYAIAASIVLLPLAFVCDLFYRKYEPIKKSGAAMVILVIHAVLFALLGIGALITAAFTGLNMAINAGNDLDGQLVLLLVTGFATLLYAAAFVRTLNPFKNKKGATVYAFSMLGVTVLLLILAVVGPVVQSIASRDDRRIEENLSSVQQGVEAYITENNKLPESLNDIDVTGSGARSLLEDNLVEYKKETSVQTQIFPVVTTYRYQLCVEYKGEKNADRSYESDRTYKPYLSTYSHDKGTVCYKLEHQVSGRADSTEGSSSDAINLQNETIFQ